jgi:hypothetical protein
MRSYNFRNLECQMAGNDKGCLETTEKLYTDEIDMLTHHMRNMGCHDFY